MDADRWNRIQALFAQALALAPSEREHHLRTACGHDQALLDEVLKLLAHDAAGEAGTLSRIVQDSAAAVLSEQAALPPGRRFGAWEATGHIAFGGMGAVYRARRADGAFEQDAALKLLNPAMVGPGGRERLQAERQILAGLNHPGIARLLDGGTADDGMPYLVMEFVDGLPIDRYCREQGLGTAARLRLFLRVCEAVDHAHRNLVVHRDIKPSNLLVTADGSPKLLDFGISKLLDAADPALTGTGQRLLTPSHASPEQVLGGPITTATDVYGLGVLLYQLLAEALPFGEGSTGSAQVAHDVVHTQPTRPSARASSPALRREIDGDLDNIVLMALRKEPQRRYASVQALADDVRAVLEHRPVSARADTLAYRTGKFLRRHRLGVAAAGAAAAVLASVVLGYTLRLDQERERAESQARVANQVAEFMEALFEQADPFQSGQKLLTAEALLKNGAARLERDPAVEPLVRARLLGAIGRSNVQLGHAAEAEKQLRLAAELFAGPEHRDYRCGAQRSLANALHLLGRRDEARQWLLPCASDRPADELDRIQAIHVQRLGIDDMATGRYDEGEERLRRSLAATERLGSHDKVMQHEATVALGMGLGYLGRHAEGKTHLQQAVELARQVHGPDSVLVAATLSQLSWLSRRSGDGEGALAAAQQAEGILARLFAPEHPRNLSIRHGVARSLASLGRYEEALARARETAALAAKQAESWGATVSLNATSLVVEALKELGRLAEAEAEAARVLSPANPVATRAGQTGAVLLAEIARRLGDARVLKGDLPGAEAALRRGLQLLGEQEGQQQMRTGLRERLARVLLDLGRPAEGDALYRQTLEDADRLYGTRAPEVYGRVLGGYAQWLEAAGRGDDAARWRQQHGPAIAKGSALLEAAQQDMARWRAAAAKR